jgi:hypothetical protein
MQERMLNRPEMRGGSGLQVQVEDFDYRARVPGVVDYVERLGCGVVVDAQGVEVLCPVAPISEADGVDGVRGWEIGRGVVVDVDGAVVVGEGWGGGGGVESALRKTILVGEPVGIALLLFDELLGFSMLITVHTMTVFQRSRPGSQLRIARPSSSSKITSSQLRTHSVHSISMLLKLLTYWIFPGRLASMVERPR